MKVSQNLITHTNGDQPQISSQEFVILIAIDVIHKTEIKNNTISRENTFKKEIHDFLLRIMNTLRVCQKSLVGAIIYFERISLKYTFSDLNEIIKVFCMCIVLSLKMWTDRYWENVDYFQFVNRNFASLRDFSNLEIKLLNEYLEYRLYISYIEYRDYLKDKLNNYHKM
jgi:hypothetical protein